MTEDDGCADPPGHLPHPVAGSWLALTLLILTAPVIGHAQEIEPSVEEPSIEEPPVDEAPVNPDEFEVDKDADDTADIDTDSSVDTAVEGTGVTISGDVRPLYNYLDLTLRDGVNSTESEGRLRARLRGTFAFRENFQIGARLAARCTTNSCDPDWVLERASNNGLKGGEITLDELFLHWYRTDRFNVTFGRQQTRFVLRGGVFARSLDRNDSNNTNVTWTDGLHTTYRAANGWNSHLIMQRNWSTGTGSIRRGLLDFDDSAAKHTWFIGFENTNALGPIVQRSLDISYLPQSLLTDGDIDGRRDDYWTIVGRLAARWPLGSGGTRLRTGVELGYAPNRPTRDAVNLATGVDGLAWNVVFSLMDVRPGHSIGINFGETGAAWFLSPQFRPNEEQYEVRYQWRPPWARRGALVEARFRWREDIEQQLGTVRKRDAFDAFFRITWQFSD